MVALFRWALLYEIEPVVFEGTDKIGGLWVYKPEETKCKCNVHIEASLMSDGKSVCERMSFRIASLWHLEVQAAKGSSWFKLPKPWAKD